MYSRGSIVYIKQKSEINCKISPTFPLEMERYVSSHNRKFFIHSILYKEKTFVSYFLTPIDNPEEKSYFTFTEQMMSPFSENDTKGFDIISDFCKKKCTNCSIYNCELAKKIIEMTPIIKKKVNNN